MPSPIQFLFVGVSVILMASRVYGALTTAQQTLFTNNGWTITEDGNDYYLQHTGEVDSNTYTVGNFPAIGNPNSISAQDYRIYVPKTPAAAGTTTCTPLGYIGFAINGAAIFNPLTANAQDAVSGDCAETFDTCQGHPNDQGVYHYHQIPSCVKSAVSATDPIGIALDGYLIYDNTDESGNTLTATDLDSCGGRTGSGGDYRYHMQAEYPYTLGCFKGSFSTRQNVQLQSCSTLVTCGNSGSRVQVSLLVGLVQMLSLLWLLY